jgi:hypothetical protein
MLRDLAAAHFIAQRSGDPEEAEHYMRATNRDRALMLEAALVDHPWLTTLLRTAGQAVMPLVKKAAVRAVPKVTNYFSNKLKHIPHVGSTLAKGVRGVGNLIERNLDAPPEGTAYTSGVMDDPNAVFDAGESVDTDFVQALLLPEVRSARAPFQEVGRTGIAQATMVIELNTNSNGDMEIDIMHNEATKGWYYTRWDGGTYNPDVANSGSRGQNTGPFWSLALESYRVISAAYNVEFTESNLNRKGTVYMAFMPDEDQENSSSTTTHYTTSELTMANVFKSQPITDPEISLLYFSN